MFPVLRSVCEGPDLNTSLKGTLSTPDSIAVKSALTPTNPPPGIVPFPVNCCPLGPETPGMGNALPVVVDSAGRPAPTLTVKGPVHEAPPMLVALKDKGNGVPTRTCSTGSMLSWMTQPAPGPTTSRV